MKKLMLSAILGATLLSNNALAQTYFSCTDVDNNQIVLKDNGDSILYHFFNEDGEIQLDMAKNTIKTQNSDGNHTAKFNADDVNYQILYNKNANGQANAQLKMDWNDETGENTHSYHCDSTKPIVQSLDKLN